MYKFVRVSRLLRLYNEVTDLTKASYFREFMKIDAGFLRLIFYILTFLLMCHYTACMWVVIAKLNQEAVEPGD